MGRKVRRVPANWQHPIEWHAANKAIVRGRPYSFRPLFGSNYSREVSEWDEGAAKWAEGLKADWNGGWVALDEEQRGMTYAGWAGERPVPEDYMPDWPDAERTHFQMYETTSEGTPISPVMESPEALAQWLADSGASAFARETASYEAWLRVARGGFAPSAAYSPSTGLVSGVAMGTGGRGGT